MLNPEEIQKARAKLGVPPQGYGSARVGPSATSGGGGLAGRLQSAWTPQPAAGTGLNADFKQTVNKVGGAVIQGAEDIFNERGKKAVDIYKEGVNGGSPTVHGQAEAALRQVGNVAGAVGDMFAKPIAAASESASNTESLQHFASHPVVGALLDTVNKGVMPVESAWKALEEHHPELAKDLGAVGNIAGLFIGGGGTKGAATIAGKGARVAEGASRGVSDAVGGAVSRGTTNFKDAVTAKAVDNLESKYTELLTGNKSKNAKYDKAQRATAAKNAATEGLPPQRVLAESGIVPRQEGARLRTAEQANEFRKTVAPLREANRDALVQVERSTKPVSIDQWEADTLRRAETPENINAGTADGLVKEIKGEFAALKARYGDTVPITVMDDIKSARWEPVKFDSTRPLQTDANYLMAKSAQQTIEQVAKDAGYDDVAQLNRHIGDRMEAAKFLASLDGQVVKGGRLTGLVYQAVGSTFGHTIPGKIVGALGGNAVANILISNSVAGPVKRLILRNLEKTDPEAYKAALQWLEEEKKLQDIRPRLPAGDSTKSTVNQGRPIPAGPDGPKEYHGPETRVGSYKPPMRGFIKIGKTTSDPLAIAEEHITSTKQILENLPKEEIESLGGMGALLSRAKTNIVDGLRAEGLTKESNAIAKIDETAFKDVDSFDAAVQQALPDEVAFKNFNDLSTKLLGKLEGRTTVSKQFIEDLTNSADLKQSERDLFRTLLQEEGDKINVPDFANRVKSELLPLKTIKNYDAHYPAGADDAGNIQFRRTKFESINLPDELRGPVANYDERVYTSPIKTSAANVHFPNENINNYFAHSRIEDLPNSSVLKSHQLGEPLGDVSASGGTTRRVIEIQSDLHQKGRLEQEIDSMRFKVLDKLRDGHFERMQKELGVTVRDIDEYVRKCL